MRGDYKYWRGCMRPEVDFSLYDWELAHPVPAPIASFPDIYLDGIPDGMILNGSVYLFGGGYRVSLTGEVGGLITIILQTATLNFGVAYTNVQLLPTWGAGKGFIDTILVAAGTGGTSFKCAKNSGGPMRRTCVRTFVNFNGSHDNWVIEDSNNYISYFNIVGNFTTVFGTSKRLYGTIERLPADPTHYYNVQLYDDALKTTLLYETVDPQQYGVKNNSAAMTDGVDVAGYCSSYVAVDPGSDEVFEIYKAMWQVDVQSPSPQDFIDISPYLSGQFRITSAENEGILNKDVSRKVNMTLKNEQNIFDYRIFQAAYNPFVTPPHINGPYDTYIYDQTGGTSGGGKKIGNIRAGRFVVVQVGVYDETSATFIWLDKFRGRLGDLQYSRADNTVQLTIDDERTFFQRIKTDSEDFYINQSIEAIFADQCEKRLGFAPSMIVAPTTGFNVPFIYMQDAGETVWNALVKLVEAIGGKIDLMEDGTIKLSARLLTGDQAYVFGAGNGEDEIRTVNDYVKDDNRMIMSGSTMYNQRIINRVQIQSKPTLIEQSRDKVWKFKAFYDQDKGRNTGYLLSGRFFGDMWAQNTYSYSATGPVKSIDRSAAWAGTIRNESYILKVTAVPGGGGAGTCDITITRQADGTIFAATVACNGTTEFHVGDVHPTLAGVYVVMEEQANLTLDDESELQIGIVYYAEFGDKFRLLPNIFAAGVVPQLGNTQFAIVSSVYAPGMATDWSDELVANSLNGNAHADRVVMALDPNYPAAADYNLDNIFWRNSKDGNSLAHIPLLIQNRAAHSRRVNSIEIFGRRIVEQNNMVVNVKATDLVVNAFGGEQLLELSNSFIPNTAYGEKLARFIVDNYSGPRDIPQVTMKQPRPFYQVGDRVRDVDDYSGVTKEFVINSMDEIFSLEDVTTIIKLREADAGSGAYDASTSQAIVEYQNQTDYIKAAESVDVDRGQPSTEIRRDIYMLSGISYHGRTFNFSTGQYSGAGAVPVPPAGIVEQYTGEPRTFESAPLVIVTPLSFRRTAGGGAANTPGLETYAQAVSATQFSIYARIWGFTMVYGWVHWVAIGTTKTIV